MVRWQKRPFFFLMFLLAGCGLWPHEVVVPQGVLTAVGNQLSPGAIVLLPVAVSGGGLTTINLNDVGSAELRDLLRGKSPVYLLFDPDALGVYAETAVSNIEWVQNHSQPVELTRYDGGWVLYWVVVPPENEFEAPGLLVAPGT